MNILVLSNSPVVESQGSGYVIINTANCLTNLGHRVDIVPPEEVAFLTIMGSRAKIYRVCIGMAKWLLNNKRKIKDYELIIVYGAESALAVFYIKKILKIEVPIILHSNGLEVHVNYHMKDIVENTNSKWYHFDQSAIFKYCYSSVDAIINVSKFDKDFAVNYLQLNPAKVYAIEPALPTVFFDSTPTSPSTNSIITYCGSWIARKGIEWIKESLPPILRKYPAYSLRIIGAGTNFKASDHFPVDVIQQIELYPFVESKEQLIELYSSSSIFIFPSIYESFGLVVAEAMSCKCAVICSNTGFGAGIKHNDEAFILKELNAKSLSSAVELFITDNTLREKIALNGHKRIEQLKWSNYQIQINSVVDEVINNFRAK
ncbi:glycosyltransferase family 4 protein [Hymenobacter sp. HD11105]